MSVCFESHENTQKETQQTNTESFGRIFLFSCSLFLLYSYLYCPAFCLFVFTVKHTQQKHPCCRRDSNLQLQTGERPQTLAFERSSTAIGNKQTNKKEENIHGPSGIRNRDPNNLAAADYAIDRMAMRTCCISKSVTTTFRKWGNRFRVDQWLYRIYSSIDSL
jgi:hypothetical protein